MNQATNRTPYGLLTEDEKKQFCSEAKKEGLYECWDVCLNEWQSSAKDATFGARPYRLVIEPEKYYYTKNYEGVEGLMLGKYINPEDCTVLHPERKIAIPKQETLEDKIKAKWPDKKVFMCREREGSLDWVLNMPGLPLHINAQSMKGFQGYVYEIKGKLIESRKCTLYDVEKDNILHPVAVLFEGGEG